MKENTPDKPRKVTKDNLIASAFHVWRQFDDTYYAGFAASVAYFFFMSSMPTMIVLSQLLGVFDVSLDFIREWLETHVDSSISKFVMSLFSSTSVRFTNIVLIFVAIWAASALEFSLSRLTSHILTEGQYKFNFFVERVKVLPTAVLTLASVAFTLIIYVYGEHLLRRFLQNYFIFRVLVYLKLPIVIGLFFTMILMNYSILPRVRPPVKTMVPGAIVATVGIMIITTIYGFYIGRATNYDIIYGSFANVVALMLWFYLLSWVLCIGAMFNKAWDEVTGNNLLTTDKIVSYFEKQKRREQNVERHFVSEDDKYSPETESIAVKMSRKYVKGYDEQLKKEKELLDEQRKQLLHAQDLYDDYMSD